jgi:hypothetical protein
MPVVAVNTEKEPAIKAVSAAGADPTGVIVLPFWTYTVDGIDV